MKTLDEVIEQHEFCLAIGETACGDCRYRDQDRVCRMREDALYHLKMYRSDLLQWKADRENWESHYRLEAEKLNKATEKHLLALKELKQKESEFKEARDRHFTAYRILEERLRERNEND